MPFKSTAALFTKTGNPLEVIQVVSATLPDPGEGEVIIKGLAASLNPSDVVTVEGVYATVPERTTTYTKEPAAVIGNEGLFEVVAVGAGVSNVKVGDWVLPNVKAFGTWRTHALTRAANVVPVPRTEDPAIAATIFINPTTAYQMLKDFVDLQPGDWVIQNAANSAVGRAAIQLARIWGYKTLNVVRKRPDTDDLKKELTALGATAVITEDELADPAFATSKLPAILNGGALRLGLDCVGGASGTQLANALSVGGTLVVYGSLTRQPLNLGAPVFIYKDITVRGYWLTTRVAKNPKLKDEAVSSIVKFLTEGKFVPNPMQKHVFKVNGTPEEQLKAVQAAFEVQQKGFSNKKQVIVFQ